MAAATVASRPGRVRLGRDAGLLIASSIVSSAGDWLYRLALPLIVYGLTGSPVATAATYALEYAPYLILSPVGGVLADRVDRRRLLIFTDAAAAVLLAVLAMMLWAARAPTAMVLLIAVLLAALAPVRHPAFQTLLPSVVSDADILRTNARLQSGESVVAVAGPVVAGTLIAAVGTTTVLALDAASFLLCALGVQAVRQYRGKSLIQDAKVSVRNDLWEVMAYIRSDRVILAGATVFAAANFAVFIVEANLLFALVSFEHAEPATIGVVFAAQGVGALMGAMLATPLGRRWPLGRLIIAATLVGGAATLGLLAASSIVAIAAAWSVESACGTVSAVTWFTVRAQRAPRHLLGRVVAATRMVAFAAIPAGALAGGALLALTGDLEALILISGVAQVLIGLTALLTALRS